MTGGCDAAPHADYGSEDVLFLGKPSYRYPRGTVLLLFLILTVLAGGLTFTFTAPIIHQWIAPAPATLRSASAPSQVRPRPSTVRPLRASVDMSRLGRAPLPTKRLNPFPAPLTPAEVDRRRGEFKILDLREDIEFEWKRIPGSIYFDEDEVLLDIPKAQPILLVDLNGLTSINVAEWLVDYKGYREVYWMERGFMPYEEENYPVEGLGLEIEY